MPPQLGSFSSGSSCRGVSGGGKTVPATGATNRNRCLVGPLFLQLVLRPRRGPLEAGRSWLMAWGSRADCCITSRIWVSYSATVPSSLATASSTSVLWSWANCWPAATALARLHGDRDQFARHVDPNGHGRRGAGAASVQITLCGSGRKKNASSKATKMPKLV